MVTRQLAPISRRSALRGAVVAGLGVLGACTTEPSPAPISSPAIGGALRVGALAAGGPAATDPHGRLANASDLYRMAAIYDVLTAPGAGGVATPRLAASWEVDPSVTQWRFHLRPGAVYSNGRPVRAQDVLHSVRRMADLADRNGNRLGQVDAKRCFTEGDHTVVLVTSAPDAELPRTVASRVFVVPEGVAEFSAPIGSGAFRQADLRGQRAFLLPSDTWWGPMGKLDQLELLGYPDARALEVAVTTGAVDVACDVEPVTAALAEREHGLTITRTPAALAFGVLMRPDRTPFDRAQVRLAVKLALDRKALVDTTLVGAGRPGNDAPVPSDPSFPSDLAPPATDLTRARQLLTAAGFPDGFGVELHTTDARAAMAGSANMIAEQLRKIGIRVQVVSHPAKAYWSDVHGAVPFSVTCGADTTFSEWVARTGSEFSAQLANAMALHDDARRTALANLQREVAADTTSVVWGFADALDVARPTVRGLPTDPGTARLFLDGVSFAK